MVFVQPASLLYENFRRDAFGESPARWQTTGRAQVVHIPDYDGEMRPSSFDLGTVDRYTPLDLRGLRLETTAAGGSSSATRALAGRADGDFTCDVRVKLGQVDNGSEMRLAGPAGAALVTIAFLEGGRVALRTGTTETVIGTYAADRWYNVQIRTTQGRRTLAVVVSDDRLHEQTTEVSHAITEPVTQVVLQHEGRRPGSWVLYNALSLYRTATP